MATTDFTIADVLEWARTKPAEQRYDYGSIDNCALCQFLHDRSIGFKSVGGVAWLDENSTFRPIAEPLADALVGTNDWLQPHDVRWTFGGLVHRLEKLCPETPVTKSDWARLDAYMADIELASA